jgi:hypothetical protein
VMLISIHGRKKSKSARFFFSGSTCCVSTTEGPSVISSFGGREKGETFLFFVNADTHTAIPLPHGRNVFLQNTPLRMF